MVSVDNASIMEWEAPQLKAFGTAPVMFRHSLSDHRLFSDVALARAIEAADRQDYYVNTMDRTGHNRASRREGEIRDLSGAQVIDAIHKGTLWLLLLNPHKADPGYADLLEAIYAEVSRMVPGFRTSFRKMTLLISSPRVQVHYHCDIPGQTLWQVRGEKRVYIYPNKAPFLNQPALEEIALGEAHEFALPYAEDYDRHATAIDLKPGHMLHWPLNAPHRIVNGDCVNVSFTTEHFTPSNRRSFYVNYANGVLRKRLGWQDLSQTTSGPAYWAKVGVATGYKLLRKKSSGGKTMRIDFNVDPAAADCVRNVPPYEIRW
jgi:hypothetical protein